MKKRLFQNIALALVIVFLTTVFVVGFAAISPLIDLALIYFVGEMAWLFRLAVTIIFISVVAFSILRK